MGPGGLERTEGPIESEEGFVYEAWEARKADIAQARIGPAYGCRNIETPRKRFLLMRWNRNG